MDMSIIVPTLYARTGTNRPELLGGEVGIPDAANVFNRHSFVVLTSGALIAVATAGILTCGLCLDASKATALVDPPDQFFGDRHFPVNPKNQRFAISCFHTDGIVGQNGDVTPAPQMSDMIIGEAYGILRLANSNHVLNQSNTTNDFFIVVEKPSQYNGIIQDADTYNPVVIVEIVPAAIQLI